MEASADLAGDPDGPLGDLALALAFQELEQARALKAGRAGGATRLRPIHALVVRQADLT